MEPIIKYFDTEVVILNNDLTVKTEIEFLLKRGVIPTPQKREMGAEKIAPIEKKVTLYGSQNYALIKSRLLDEFQQEKINQLLLLTDMIFNQNKETD
jgi:hypothetical protein